MTDAAIQPLRSVREPYTNQAELIQDRLDALRERLRVAGEHLQVASLAPRATAIWPMGLRTCEREIGLRIDATRTAGTTFPLVQMMETFKLGTGEDLVLWLLVAHELCPTTRKMIRELGTEVPDPTTDTIRRVVFGADPRPDAWRIVVGSNGERAPGTFSVNGLNADLAAAVLAAAEGRLDQLELALEIEIVLPPRFKSSVVGMVADLHRNPQMIIDEAGTIRGTVDFHEVEKSFKLLPSEFKSVVGLWDAIRNDNRPLRIANAPQDHTSNQV